MNLTYFNTENFTKEKKDINKALTDCYNLLKVENLPFITLDFLPSLISEIEKIEKDMQKFKHLLLLGVGGSALGPQALQQSFYPQDRQAIFNKNTDLEHKKQLWVADNVDMHFFNDCLSTLLPEQTLVLVISKSGSTLETMSQYFICKKWLQDSLPNTWTEHLFAITDVKKGFLRQEVNKYNYKSMEVPELLGGRFSVFSAVGALPAAFLGIDYKGFLKGANDARDEFFASAKDYLNKVEITPELYTPNRGESNVPEVFKWAYFAYEAMENDFSELIIFNYLPAWASLGAWFRQLWSESLGKKGHGSTPIPALGATDQHSILQLFLDGKKDKACLFINQTDFVEKNKNYIQENPKCIIPDDLPEEWKYIAGKTLSHILEAESMATKQSLINAKIPLLSMEPMETNEYNFGKLTWNFGLMTILTAYLLGIDPLDQPAVEEGKIIAKKMLAEK